MQLSPLNEYSLLKFNEPKIWVIAKLLVSVLCNSNQYMKVETIMIKNRNPQQYQFVKNMFIPYLISVIKFPLPLVLLSHGVSGIEPSFFDFFFFKLRLTLARKLLYLNDINFGSVFRQKICDLQNTCVTCLHIQITTMKVFLDSQVRLMLYFSAYLTTLPQMTFYLGMWPLTSLTSEGSLDASMN